MPTTLPADRSRSPSLSPTLHCSKPPSCRATAASVSTWKATTTWCSSCLKRSPKTCGPRDSTGQPKLLRRHYLSPHRDNFVLQAGDPTATGTSGSTLGNFDDQFNANLLHNRTGVLSFAKSSDDTNNSQFFITEGAQRSLDFNHSIFGQLTEGDDVREAISELDDAADRITNTTNNKPSIDIKMTSVDVFTDTENALIRLKLRAHRPAAQQSPSPRPTRPARPSRRSFRYPWSPTQATAAIRNRS